MLWGNVRPSAADITSAMDPRLLGGGRVLYLHNNASDLEDHSQAIFTEPDEENSSYTATGADTRILLHQFATDPAMGNVPAGAWVFTTFCAVSHDDKTSIGVEVYHRTAAGVETILAEFSQKVQWNVIAPMYYAVPMDQVMMADDDIIVVRYYAEFASLTSRTLYMDVEGNAAGYYWWSNVRIPGDGSEGIEDIIAEDDPQYPISYLKYIKAGVEYPITEIPKANGLIWGGGVSWVELLNFNVSAAAYYLGGTLFTTPSTAVALDAADPDNPRIDIIIVDENETVSVIKGTPAENPQKPTIDPETQIELTEVLVPAGATQPGTISTAQIYDENTEWAGVASGVTADFESVTSPFHGSKCVSVGNDLSNNDSLTFTGAVAVDVTDFQNLVLYIKLKAAMSREHNLYASWLHNGVLVSNEVLVPVNKTNVTTWQGLAMLLTLWSYGGSTVDGLRLRWSKTRFNTPHAGFYLDFVKLEAGVIQQVVNDAVILTGDVTGSGVTGSPIPTTLKTVNSNVGQFGNATNVPKITVDAKGRITAVEEVVIEPGMSEVETADSVVGSGSASDPITLDGDEAEPGPLKYYGTDDSSEPVKGFHDLPTGADLSIISESSGSFNVSSTHLKKYCRVNYATDVTATLPADTFSAGDWGVFEQKGNGTVTIDGDSGVTVNGYDGLTTYGQYAGIMWLCVASNTFIVIAGTGY